MTRLLAALVLAALVGAGAVAASEAANARALMSVRSTTRADALPAVSGAEAATAWCGAAASSDRKPNVVAGNPVHWVYVIPSDGSDNLSTVASVMQADADSIDTWWRGQDPTRVPRNDLTTFSCGPQLDITTVRASRSSAQLAPLNGRFSAVVDALNQAGLGSSLTKYIAYYDGSVSDENVCGQGGGNSSAFGVAVVYDRSCVGVSTAAVAAHEFLHAIGAVPSGAPNGCEGENSGHTCDDKSDLMYPALGGEPLTAKLLDPGRNDYYGHAGAWLDTQDSAWLVRLDSQARLAVAVSGAGSVSSDVPGPAVHRELHDDLERRSAARAHGDTGHRREARALDWRVHRERRLPRGRRNGRESVSPLRTRDLPADGRGDGTRLGAELANGHHLPTALLGVLPLVRAGAADSDTGARLEASRLERCLSRCEGDVHGADERRVERARDLRPALRVRQGRPRNDQVASFVVDAVHDVVVIGAGCAGMRAAIEAFDAGADVALLSKIHPVRSHSGAAEGGINAALGNASEDDPEKHAFDTVKGSDYLGDQDAIEILCNEAPGDVYQLEQWGAVFSRTADGRIAQRPFGAAGEPRTAYAADITGHVLIHVLYEQVMKRDIPTYEEFFAWKLVVDDERCQGVIAWDLMHGGLALDRGEDHDPRDGRGRPPVHGDDERLRLHRRRDGARAPVGSRPEGHGDDAVPPHDARTDRRAHHRGVPRRGRVSPEQGG